MKYLKEYVEYKSPQDLIGKIATVIDDEDAWYVKPLKCYFNSNMLGKSFVIKSIEKDANGDILIGRKEGYASYRLSKCEISDEPRVGKHIFREEDPYGEEDWGDNGTIYFP